MDEKLKVFKFIKEDGELRFPPHFLGRPPQSESVPGVVLLKCAFRMAFFKMCLAENLQNATDCGGLFWGAIFLKVFFTYDFGSGWSSSDAELSFICSWDGIWWVWVVPCPAWKHGIMSSMSIVAMSVSMSVMSM
jgi:hypothetical protein